MEKKERHISKATTNTVITYLMGIEILRNSSRSSNISRRNKNPEKY